MKNYIHFAGLCTALLAGPACAQLPVQPPAAAQRPVADAAMVIRYDNAEFEVLPTFRASPAKPSSGNPPHAALAKVSADARFTPDRLGVVYDRTLRTFGLITGEISFKMKGTLQASGFDPDLYPGLMKLTNANVYVVVTSTPVQFVSAFRALKSRTDLEWIEPHVIYSGTASAEQAVNSSSQR